MDELAGSLAGLELALEECQAFVHMAKLVDPPADLGTLGGDRRPQLVGDLPAPAVGAHGREFRGHRERQIQLAQPDEEAQALGVLVSVLAVAAAVSCRRRQEPEPLVVAQSLGCESELHGHFTDPHATTLDPVGPTRSRRRQKFVATAVPPP